MLHLFGSGLGQNGSTRYCGAPFLSTACFGTTCAWVMPFAANAAMAQKPTKAAQSLGLVMARYHAISPHKSQNPNPKPKSQTQIPKVPVGIWDLVIGI